MEKYNTSELSLGLSWLSFSIYCLKLKKKKKSRNGSTSFSGREVIIRRSEHKRLLLENGVEWRKEKEG